MNNSINPNRFTDSAGVPWEGRSFEKNSFSEDDGSAPENLIATLASFRKGEVGAELVIDEIRNSRLLVPLVAHLGEAELGAHGHTVDKSAELSIVTVKSPDDQDSLVAFSSVAAMSLWNESARPVPSDAVRIALAAASQSATRIALDPGSETEFVIRRPAIARIAQSLPWFPPEKDPEVYLVIKESLASEADVVEFELASGDPTAKLQGPELSISIRIRPGLEPEAVRQLLERVSRRWSVSEVFASSVDSVAVKLVS